MKSLVINEPEIMPRKGKTIHQLDAGIYRRATPSDHSHDYRYVVVIRFGVVAFVVYNHGGLGSGTGADMYNDWIPVEGTVDIRIEND